MKFRSLSIFSGVLIVLAVGVFGLNRWGGGSSSEVRTGKSVMGTADVSQATKIQIQSHEGMVTLVQVTDNQWTVLEQNGFSASPQKIKALLVKLNTEKIAHLTTDKKEKLAGLNVLTAEENGGKWEKGKTGYRIRFLDAQDKSLFDMVIGRDRGGERNVGFGGTYIRFVGEEITYLIKDTVLVDYRPEDWIDKEIFDEVADKVLKSIRIRKPGKKEMVFSREKPEAKWTLAGVPPERLKQTEIKSLANLIGGMDLSKIAPADKPAAELGRKRMGQVNFEFFDQRKFTLEIGDRKAKDDYRYFTIKANLDPSVSDQKLKARVTAFNERFQNQIIGIYDWDGSKLLQERKEFLAERKEVKKTGAKNNAAKSGAAKKKS